MVSHCVGGGENERNRQKKEKRKKKTRVGRGVVRHHYASQTVQRVSTFTRELLLLLHVSVH